MTDGSHSTTGTAGHRAKVGGSLVLAVAVLGVLADVTGLFGFVTGKDLPGLLHRPDPSPLASATASQSTMVAEHPTKRPAVKKTAAPTSRPTHQPQASPKSEKSGAPAGTDDAIKNFQLGLSPPTFAAAKPRTILIETWEGRPNAFVDVEIADPTASGGVCPKLTAGPCNLLYGGGERADGNGRSQVKFQWYGDEAGHDGIHHPGTYTVTVQDRGTGTKLSLDFTAE